MSDSIDDRLMSSSSSEPENAVPTDTVRAEQGQPSSRHGDKNQSRPVSHTSISHSTSLLTRALTASHIEDEGLKDVSARTPKSTSTSLPREAPPAKDPTADGVSILRTADQETNQMADVAPASISHVGGSMSLGKTPLSSVFNLQSIVQANAALTTQHALLNGSRPRSTSLQRTEKERKVEGSPKGTYSTNPGDTALPPSPEIHPLALNSNNPPTEGVRAHYRSWRDVKPAVASEKAWSIGEQGSDIGHGQVERSITQAMTGAEHNTRSRKASHTLGLFKEGLPDDKPKKRESKSRGRSKEGLSRGKIIIDPDSGIQRAGQGRQLNSSPPATLPESSVSTSLGTNSTIDLTAQGSQQDAFISSEILSEEEVKSMPAQLLAQIRKHHNLTPGASKGTPFSPSIPATASEQARSHPEEGSLNLPTAFKSDPETCSTSFGADSTGVKCNDEDDESGEEKISSALFIPHHSRLDSSEAGSRDSEKEVGARPTNARRDTNSLSQDWLEEHTVLSREVDEQCASPEPRPLSVSSVSHLRDENLDSEKEVWSPTSDNFEPDGNTALNDTGLTIVKHESSLLDTHEVAPGASFKLGDTIPGDYSHHHHEHQLDPRQPLEAIELIPYRHQVGGHTTVWRFSPRALAKQLSNRENEFYERVERYHPQLLKFLPRYIGVLNVTFEKQTRRKSTLLDDVEGASERRGLSLDYRKRENEEDSSTLFVQQSRASPNDQASQSRVVSQSMITSSAPIPRVTFADNRHIIPKSFMLPHPRLIDAEHSRSKSDGAERLSTVVEISHLNGDSNDSQSRPTLSDKHAASWGATTVNKQLRNQVFEEAFLRQPIPIQPHRKPASQHRSLPSRHSGSSLRASNSESSLKAAQQSQAGSSSQPPEESIRIKAMKTAAEQRIGNAPIISTGTKQSEATPDAEEEDNEADEKTGTSAPEPEIARSPQGKRQRRYSSGGLRRKPDEVAENRGNLKYFEEADDAGYKGDCEEDVFSMDLEQSQETMSPSLSANQPTALTIDVRETIGTRADYTSNGTSGAKHPATTNEPARKFLNIPRPANPKEALITHDTRVVYFLVLEDLTAGMRRPCVMDLKMGTRQYGVEANEKKQKSQQRKSEATTSRELGVRVCGLQVWDLKTKEYIFLDKYYGRKLKAGRQFQDALTRFLYDGVDYSSVLRHIPVIIAKLSKLEVLIEGLIGYRFYAASLLVFYEGDPSEVDESDSTTTEKEVKQKNEIDFKIADFANSVTNEDCRSGKKPCPPRHPDQPDKGFLRGLRSLKKYFLAIQREIRAKEMGHEQELKSGLDVSDDLDAGGGAASY